MEKSVSLFAGSVRSEDSLRLMSWLRIQRKRQGLTMRMLGQRLQVPGSCIHKIENGERRLDVVEFKRYCEALAIDPLEALNILLS